MGLKCLFGHKWNGCKCKHCGITRDEGHQYETVFGKCFDKCKICGKERVAHNTVQGKCNTCGKYILKDILSEADDIFVTQIFTLFTECELRLSTSEITKFLQIMHDYIKNTGLDADEILVLSQYCIDSAKHLLSPDAVSKVAGTKSIYSGFTQEKLMSISGAYSKLSVKLSKIVRDENPAGNVKQDAVSGGTILDKYRVGLSYLDGCGTFDKAKYQEFNRIIGNQFSDTEMENQIKNSELMIRGMEDLKQTLRSSIVEAIGVFEEIERQGIDLSKYSV
jgi:hypothetical protein